MSATTNGSGQATVNGHARNGHCNGSARHDSSQTTAQSAPAPTPGFTPEGRFAKGNKFGKGNPFARRLGKLRSAFLDAVSDEDVAALARRLKDLAMAGDMAAATLFLSYALGKPAKVVDVDRLDLHEFALLDAAPTTARVLALLTDSTDPAVASADVHENLRTDPAQARRFVLEQVARNPQCFNGEMKARIGKR
jgi:hypothetical protein